MVGHRCDISERPDQPVGSQRKPPCISEPVSGVCEWGSFCYALPQGLEIGSLDLREFCNV